MTLRIQHFGWRRDSPDHRDLPLTAAARPPARLDLRETGHLDFEIYDQGELGSCTANAIAAGVRFLEAKEGAADKTPTSPSRLFVYYAEREREGTVGVDAGAELRDGLKVISKVGYPDESLWPYEIARFAERPPPSVYQAAARDRVTRYYRVKTDAAHMRSALALGYPVVIGVSVFESFMSGEVARTGMVPAPRPGEPPISGHAMLLVAFDDERRLWTCRNSWGQGHGDGGHVHLPYGYLDSPAYAGDFWTARAETTD